MQPLVMRVDEDEIARTIDIVCQPDAVVELRILNALGGGTVSGYFDGRHREALIEAAVEWSGKALGVYFTPNPVDPTVMARAWNRAKRFARDTTKDDEILRRIWLLIDFDPKRPAGISSTEEEHKAALDRAKECREFLRQQGFPEPVFADSGNGAHLLLPMNAPNDSATTDRVRRTLEVLADRFSDNVVDVDRCVYNAARIWKLYGTLSAKGDSTPDRPHRIARILEVPTNE